MLCDEARLERRRLGQSDIQNAAWVQRPGYGSDEVGISLTHQNSENMRVGILELRGSHHVRVGVDPYHRQIVAVAFAQIGDRREIDQTVTAQRHNCLRLMPGDGRTGSGELIEQRLARNDAAVNRPIVLCRSRDRDRFHRSLRLWGDRC